MATTDKPSASIKHQAQTDVPVNGDDTIMDDTEAIMDDETALMGGPTVSIESGKNKMYTVRPKADMPRSR